MTHFKIKRLKQDQLFYFHKLSPIQRDICLGVLDGQTWADAYRDSPHAKATKARDIDKIIRWMKKSEDVISFMNSVRELDEELDERIMRRHEALSILSMQARSNIADILEFKTIVDPDTGESVNVPVLRNPDEIGNEIAASIAEISNTQHGIKVKQHSPRDAIAMLARMQGWEPDKKTSNDGSATDALAAVMSELASNLPG